MSDYIDTDALGNEALLLTVMPTAATGVWMIAAELLKSQPPYLSSLITMLALTYVAMNMDDRRMSKKELQTRIGLDALATGAAIAAGNTNYAFTGPPEPGNVKSAPYTILGIACVVAVIRAVLFTAAYLRKLMD